MLVVDGVSKIVDKLAVMWGNDADENEGPSFVAVPARSNSLDNVSVACATAASVLAEVVPLPASDCSDPVAVDGMVVRATGVARIWFEVLIEKTPVLLAAKSSASGVAVGMTEDVTANIDASELAMVEGVDKEDIGIIGTGVEVWMPARFEAISVWLRKRAAL